MAEKKEAVLLEDGRTVKVAMVAVYSFLTSIGSDLLDNVDFTKLLVASKGGFSGVDSFVTIDGVKVGRVCAMTGAVFAHDNTDKALSFFYKNGSYMIGAEIVKANARKVWEADNEAQLLALEADMLEGVINPRDWKEAKDKVEAESFEFILDDDTKAELIVNFDGYTDKDAFTEAFNAGEVPPITDYADALAELRNA